MLWMKTQQEPKPKTRVISYMPDKPDKFAIRFYAVVSSHGTYLHSMIMLVPAVIVAYNHFMNSVNRMD